MKPVLILPRDAMSEHDIDLLKENGFCVVIAKKPALVKFLDPIPAISSRTEIEAAAIRTTEHFLNKTNGELYQVAEVKACFVRLLLKPGGSTT
jgi:hypothetical protein